MTAPRGASLDTPRLWRRVTDAVAAVPDEASTPPEGARVGAVLALLEDSDDGPRLLFTRRRSDLRAHPGQLSFPGGRIDVGETAEQAALREAHEEIGLDAATVEIAGTGPTFYIPPSRFWVVPVIGRWREPHDLEPNPWEVAEVLHVPIATLLEKERWRWVPLADAGAMWAWQLAEDLLWGATAMMVATLLEVMVEGWTGGLSPDDLGPERERRPWESFPSPEPRIQLPGLPEIPIDEVPVVTAKSARRVDRLLRDDVRVELAQLREHAGRAVADAVRRVAGGDVTGVGVTVLAGPGGNGAAGLAAARLLHAAGSDVHVALVGTPRDPDQVEGLRRIEVPVAAFGDDLVAGAVVVDSLLGVGARPPVRAPVADAIAWLQGFDVPTVAVDLPSGIHPDDGVSGLCVTADVTIALGAPKPAHAQRICMPYLGDLYLADLGIPAHVWQEAGLEPVDVFGRGPLVRLVPPGRIRSG